MAGDLTGNTTYGSSETSTTPGRFSSIANKIKASQTTATKNVGNQKLLKYWSPTSSANLFGTPSPQTKVNVPNLNRPYLAIPTVEELMSQGLTKEEADSLIAKQTVNDSVIAPRSTPLTSSYTSLRPLVSESDKQFYTDPTDKASIINYPEALGGGQYINDPSVDPNKAIYSDRVLFNDKINPGARAKILGDLPSNLYEVEHNIPLWLGGADTLENIGIYDIATHRTKTAVQAVPLTLWRNGVINLNEAKLMALTWKDKDATGLPSTEEINANGGQINLDLAKSISQKWKDDISKPNTAKYFKESFVENMQNFGKSEVPDAAIDPVGAAVVNFFREGAKGLVGSATANIIPGTETSADSGLAGKIGHLAGTALGFVSGIKALNWGTGLLTGGLKGGIAGLLKLQPEIARATETFETVGKTLKESGILRGVARTAAKIDGGVVSSNFLANNIIKSGIVQSIKDMTLFNQLGLSVRELTGQEKSDLSNHTKQLINDIKYGALTSIWGQSVPGYLGVASSVTTMSLIDGDGINEALESGITMAAFHTMGAKGRFKAGGPMFLKGEILPQIASEQEYKKGKAAMSYWLKDTNILTPVREGQMINAIEEVNISAVDNLRKEMAIKYPEDRKFNFVDVSKIQTQEQAITFLREVAKKNLVLTDEATPGGLPDEQFWNEMKRITASANALYKRTLDPETRQIKEKEDMKTAIEKQEELNSLDEKKTLSERLMKALRKTSSGFKEKLPYRKAEASAYEGLMKSLSPQIESKLLEPDAQTVIDKYYTPQIDKIIEKEVTSKLKNENIVPLEEGESKMFGTARGRGNKKDTSEPLNPVVKKNIEDFATRKKEKIGTKVYVIRDKQTQQFADYFNLKEQYTPGQEGSPALRIIAMDIIDGKEVPVSLGNIPTRASNDAIIGDINETRRLIGNRLKAIFATSKDFKEFKTRMIDPKLGDKSRPILNEKKLKELWEMKEAVYKMGTDEINKLIPQENGQKKYTMDTETLSQIMEERGLPILTLRIENLRTAAESGAKVANGQSKNPHIEFSLDDQGVIDAHSMKETRIKKSTSSIQKGLSKAIAKQQQERDAATIAAIPKAEKPLTDVERLQEASKPLNTPKVMQAEKTLATEGKIRDTELPETDAGIDTFLNSVETVVRVKYPGEYIQTRKGEDGIDDYAFSVIGNKGKMKELTRAENKKVAKAVSKNGEYPEDIIAGWPEYLKQYTQKIRTAKGDESFMIKDPDIIKAAHDHYVTLASEHPRKEVIKSDKDFAIAEGSMANAGKIDLETRHFNKLYKAEGFKEDSMEVLSLNKNIGTFESKSPESFDKLVEKLGLKVKVEKDGDVFLDTRDKYVPITITGKGLDNVLLIKYDDAMVKRVKNNLSKYQNEGEKLLTEEDMFVRGYMMDILKLPKNMKVGDFVKRGNLLYQRYDKYLGTDKSMHTFHVLKAQSLRDINDFKIDKSMFETPNSPETEASIKSYYEMMTEDGPFFLGEDAFDAYIKGTKIDPEANRGSLKIIIDTMINGQKVYHKGQAIRIDAAWRAHLESTFGIKVGRGDIISFDTNAKIMGNLGKTGTWAIPLSDIYVKNKTTGDSVSKESSSTESKYTSSDEGVTEDKLIKVNKEIEDLQGLIHDIAKTKNNKELLAVFNKNVEKFKELDPEALFRSLKQTKFEHGAAKNVLNTEINKVLKNQLVNYIINPKYKYGTMLILNPVMKADYDGNGVLRYPKVDEIVMGVEQMKDLNVKEGDEVVVHRDPSYDINNMVVLKVLNGTKVGNTSLGKENGSVHPFVERMILQGDQDADTIHVTRIGEGGMPQSEVNAIKKNGKLAIPFTEVNVSNSGEKYVTARTIREKIKDQLIGDDQTSQIAINTRIAQEVVDNQLTIKVSTNGKYSIYAGGIKVDEGLTEKPQSAFTAIPRWTIKEKKVISQAMREAVDSKKSDDIKKTTSKTYINRAGEVVTELNDFDWALKQIWSVAPGERIDSVSVRGALKKIQAPYNIKKLAERSMSINDIYKGKLDKNKEEIVRHESTGLKPTMDYYKRLVNAGVALTPLQAKNLAVSKVFSYDMNKKTIRDIHETGKSAVLNTFRKDYLIDTKYKKNIYDNKNPKVTEIEGLARMAQIRYSSKNLIPNKNDSEMLVSLKRERKAKIRSEIEDFYFDKLEKGDYTKKDIKDIAFWAATQDSGNIAWGMDSRKVRYNKPYNIYLYDEMILESPEISKVYYEGSETLDPYHNLKTPEVKKTDVKKPNTEEPTDESDPGTGMVDVPEPTNPKKPWGSAVGINPETGKIELNEAVIKQNFDTKSWAYEGKVDKEGVKTSFKREKLPIDTFKTIEEYKDFLIKHEEAHLKNPPLEGEAQGDYAYESRINKIALENLKNMPKSDFVNHNGGAKGSDMEWENVGKEYGIKTNAYSFEGHKSDSKSRIVLTDAQLKEGEQAYKKAAIALGKHETFKPWIRNLLLRDYHQAKNADSIFAIGKILENGKVDGGTGYAVQMARDMGKPVHVFDLARGGWFKSNVGTHEWIPEGTPTLTKNFAGIGTRAEATGLPAEAKQAIREVYEKTLNSKIPQFAKNVAKMVNEKFDTHNDGGAEAAITKARETWDNQGAKLAEEAYNKDNMKKGHTTTPGDLISYKGREFKYLGKTNTNALGKTFAKLQNMDGTHYAGTPDLNNINLVKKGIKEWKNIETLVDAGDKDVPLMKPNEEQKGAIDKIMAAVEDPNKKNILLEGEPGTGKTFVIKHIIQKIKEAYPDKPITITALSHAAKNVSKGMVKKEDTVYTLHSVLEMRPNVDVKEYNTDKTNFQRFKKKVKENEFEESIFPKEGILIVDEVSFMNKRLVKDTLEAAAENNTFVIFIGDREQIPPVGEKGDKSVIFNNVDDTVTLNQQMRLTDANPIAPTFREMRKNKIAEPNKYALRTRETNLNDKGDGIEYLQSGEDGNKFIEGLANDFKEGKQTIGLTYTNKNVKQINDAVREKLGFRGYPHKGERMLAYSKYEPYENGKKIKFQENNDTVVVLGRSDPREKTIFGVKVMGFDLELRNEGVDEVEMFVLDPKLNNEKTRLELEKNQEAVAKEVASDPDYKMRKVRWAKEFYPQFNAYSLMDAPLLDKAFHAKEQTIGYGYARTSHKGQATTYDTVHINEANLQKAPEGTKMINALLYTNMTRARKKVTMLTDQEFTDKNGKKVNAQESPTDQEFTDKNGKKVNAQESPEEEIPSEDLYNDSIWNSGETLPD